jgi:hypothetical protein
MAAKRVKKDTLTGGTQDVNPQVWTIQVVQSSSDANAQLQLPTPVSVYQTTGSGTQVLEILRVTWDTTGFAPSGSATTYNIIGYIATASLPGPQNKTDVEALVANPLVISYVQKNYYEVTAASYQIDTDPFQLDYTDGAGHGILVATRNIYLGISTNGGTATGKANYATARILYRLKNVDLADYVGIVASQTQ